jgi:nucleoside-diphosphate kinase
MAVNDERYVFIVEWFDTSASLIRSYNLIYFMADKTIEMVLCMYNIVRFKK